jgi:hypothetical protein
MKKLIFLLILVFITSSVHADLIGDLGKTLTDAVYTPLYNSVYNMLSEFMSLVFQVLVWNPPLDSAYDSWNIVRTVISSLYLAVLTYAGLKLMTGTLLGEDERNTLKKWVGGTVISILLVNMSYTLYGLVIQLNVGLCALVFKHPNFQGFITASAAFYLLLSFEAGLVLLVILLLILRTLIVLVGVVLFPIGIFFYYFPPMKRFGKFINTIIFANIFIQFFEVLCLRICFDAFGVMGNEFTSTVFTAVFGITVMLLMLFVPIVAYGFAALSGIMIHKATNMVTKVVPIDLSSFKTRGKQ